MSNNPSRTLPSLAPPPGASTVGTVSPRTLSPRLEPPVARAVPRASTIHGETRVD